MKKSIISLLSLGVGTVLGGSVVGGKMTQNLVKKQEMSDKHLSLFLMMNQWVRVKQEGKGLETFFEKKDYYNIAIYGMSYAGETLLNELAETDIHVKYAIDKNSSKIYSDVTVCSLDDDLEKVDAIVVTAITYYDEIRDVLEDKVDCPIISLEDILYEV